MSRLGHTGATEARRRSAKNTARRNTRRKTGAAALGRVQKAVSKCTRCELCHTRNRAVPGIGSGSAGVVLVGEAPGRSEDLRGEPFVGSAGKKLDEALRYAGILRESVYITNVVKCRPPNNRVPAEEEREACRRHLESELSILHPRIICILGNTAFESLLGKTGVTRHRGELVSSGGWTYFVTVHPAATIYNPKLMPVLKRDMKKLAGLLRQ